jgi:hypothetical protein
MGKIRVGGITIVTFKCVCGVTLDSDELHTRYDFNEIMTIVANHVNHMYEVIERERNSKFDAILEAHGNRRKRDE